jgi:multiple sugar transport system ATP-binding protein
MTRVELNTLRREFGETTALDGITLSVPDGEFLVLVGPSGCGKSTLLRTISGLETQTGGEISVDGELVNTTPQRSAASRWCLKTTRCTPTCRHGRT